MHIRRTLDYHLDVVEGMMSASEPFGEVETFINEAAALDWTSRQLFGCSPGRCETRGSSEGKRGPCSVPLHGAQPEVSSRLIGDGAGR